MNTQGTAWQRAGAPVLCLLLSLLLHAGLMVALCLLPQSGKRRMVHTVSAQAPRMVQVRRAQAEKQTPPEPKTADERLDKPFAKTSPDTPQAPPEQADFVGARRSRAASDPTARDRRSEAHAPAAEGRERSDAEEIVTFDEERQDGELSSEGRNGSAPTAPQQEQDIADHESPPPAEGTPDGAVSDTASETSELNRPAALLTTQPLPGDIAGTLLRQTEFPAEATDAAQNALGVQQSRGNAPAISSAARRRAVYDPALSAEAQQPGFRTYERKTRSSGRFVFGKGAALNVEATPRGQYEAEIYRRVARSWYAACDEHRGDIVPGQITISLRLNRQGQLVNMQLIRRRGAGVSQQSFTYAAIRRAALPPMPAAVQNDIVGELLELIFTFHFD